MVGFSKPYVIGIAGGSASGKTSVINDLKNRCEDGDIAVISQDNYYFDRHLQERDARGEVNFDLPGAIDRRALEWDVQTLVEGRKVVRKEYTFNNPDVEPDTITVHPASVIIVEGLFVFHFGEVARFFDLKVYIDARDEVKLQRRLKRDARERGYPESDVLYRWENHVMPSFREFLMPHRDYCDVVIVNNERYTKGLSVLESHVRNVLGRGIGISEELEAFGKMG